MRIVFRPAQGSEKTFILPEDGVVRLGAGPSCQIRIEEPGILSVHAFIKCVGGRAALIVQDAAAQVLLNGNSVRTKVLEPGDSIQLGDALLSVEAVEKDDLIGTEPGGYRIEALLGRGAMGTVYRATQLSLDRSVALKVLSPELTRDSDFVAKFLEEAKAAAKLNHANVVQIYDAGETVLPGEAGGEERRIFYFSMEYLHGGTLQQILDREGKIDLERALSIGCDTARALVWAQEHGIVHRDIKPANLLFAASGSVKVADLGIAADLERIMEGSAGSRGTGSPRYMAPEQASGKAVDHRADIYALGSTLFRAITGKLPFDARTPAEVVRLKSTEEAPRLDTILPGAPPSLSALLSRMLARVPSGRPAKCAEVLAALERCLAEVRSEETELEEAGEASGGPEGATVPRRAKRRRPYRARKGEALLWRPFLESTAGKLNISVSALIIFSACVWAAFAEPPPAAAPGPIVGSKGGAAPVKEALPISKSTPDPGPPGAASGAGKTSAPGDGGGKPSRTEVAAVAAATVGRETAILKELDSILADWRVGLIDARRAIAAMEDFKRKHPEARFADRAEHHSSQIREGLRESGKSALARLLSGDLENAVERSEFKEAVQRLVKLGDAHPFNLQEINAEIKKVTDAAEAVLVKAEKDADGASEAGELSEAIALLGIARDLMPPELEGRAGSRIEQLERFEKEHNQHGAAFLSALEKVEEAIASLEFDRAASLASSLRKVESPFLARRRATVIEDTKSSREAWQRIQSRARAAGGAAEGLQLLAAAPKDLLGRVEGPTAARVIESLGILLLYTHGPEAARELLLDARLPAGKRAAYKARLEKEGGPFLSRAVKKANRRLAELKKAGGSAAAAECGAIAAEIAKLITANRKTAGYKNTRVDLAKVYLQARAEVHRVSAPASLFRGKVVSWKDGSIELEYGFDSPRDLEDFVAAESSKSLTELEDGIAKMRGEFRLGNGDVFRNRIQVSAKLPAGGYTVQAPNMNVALWTREDDIVSPGQLSGSASGDEEPESPRRRGGASGNYFVFAIGYSARIPGARASDTLTPRGSGDFIEMPANAIFTGTRGLPLHSGGEADCLWATSVAGNVRGSQAFRVGMDSGVPSLNINSRWIKLNDVKELEVMKRTEPYLGSVTFFTNGHVLFYDVITVEGELNPAWVEERLLAAGEVDLKGIEPDYPFGGGSRKADDEEAWEKELKRGPAKAGGK
ncbi:MAG TPA: FHA domain-containing serine/threonine-protein kinase [Planctomycetota bacterium]|nr:FHA domain-containing serine/threonine-protein kinase [Planctomycetota bacterium]